METALIICAALCVALIVYIFIQQKNLTGVQSDLSNRAEENARLRELNSQLREVSARTEARAESAEKACLEIQKNADDKEHALLERQKELQNQMEMRFKLLSTELLSAQSRDMSRANDERIAQLLSPLKQDIDRFRTEVSGFYTREAAERLSLQERLKELIANNASLGREAKELSQALRGNSKVQGDWGEVVLERILENSGLRKGEEFLVQSQRDESGRAMKDEEGRGLRPDVVVRYPGERVMIIDSKVSLTAFVEYINAEDEGERQHYAKLHLNSVLAHVKELADKSYQDYIGKEKLDFVMMFIPNEAAYNAAMSLDNSLWQKAYDKRVLIVSPTQLVASLKIVAQLWCHDRQTRNAIDIAEKSGAMYDKFVGFVKDMERIEKALTTATGAYGDAMNKLRDGKGSLIGRAEKLRELGAKASKRLAQSQIGDDTD